MDKDWASEGTLNRHSNFHWLVVTPVSQHTEDKAAAIEEMTRPAGKAVCLINEQMSCSFAQVCTILVLVY